ncbi:hypothetical protein ACLOJK_024484 [Asimina triloba]
MENGSLQKEQTFLQSRADILPFEDNRSAREEKKRSTLMGRTFPDSRRADEAGPARTRAEERRLDSLDDGVESRGGKKSKERGGERREEQPGEGRGGEEEKTGRSR